MARVKAVLRRNSVSKLKADNSIDEKDKNSISYDDLKISISDYTVFNMGKQIEMPPKELELLYFLASNPNRVFTREQLLNNIWGYDYMGDTRTVDVHIKRIRAKLQENSGWRILTVWGIGYKFEANRL